MTNVPDFLWTLLLSMFHAYLVPIMIDVPFIIGSPYSGFQSQYLNVIRFQTTYMIKMTHVDFKIRVIVLQASSTMLIIFDI